MTPEAGPLSPIKIIPPLILVAVIAIGLGAGYYFASASTPSFQVTWSVRPLSIKFNSQISSSGSAPDSFTCSSPVAPVTLLAQINNPNIITLTVAPASFSSCGSTADNVVVTASCTSAALASGTCDGDQFPGTVTVCGFTPYTCLKQVLAVNVAVTTMP